LICLTPLCLNYLQEIDEYAVVPYNGFRDLNDYYTSMSALGDIPWNTEGLPEVQNTGKINSITIPFCVLHAFDDPLVTWRATVNNEGLMNPESLVKSGSGNLMLLLTKSGGHVGWPLGIFPFKDKWKWMNDAAMTFGQAVATAKMIQHDESMLSRPADMHPDEGEWQEHETEER
jgi:predicted alpha/beta-fold hydrolase